MKVIETCILNNTSNIKSLLLTTFLLLIAMILFYSKNYFITIKNKTHKSFNSYGSCFINHTPQYYTVSATA